jgi:fibro-slime domain-containing protein
MGNELCEGGYWHACVVAPTARLCSNTCGEGQQKCVDDTWLSCTVMPTKRPCSSVCGSGTETCRDDSWGVCDAPPPQPPTLQSVIRDFQPSQPDFAPCAPTCDGIGLDFGIVEPMLGADNKPVYAGDPTTPTTHGKTDFDEWYNDVPGVNDWFLPDSGKASYPPLVFTTATDGSGTFVYDNENFFPIDGQQLFGNQGAPHNYWFTIEVHSQVLYVGGETYSVSSDDDSWTFINRRLAINLGGVHAQTGASVNLDEMAEQLGIVKGQTYPLDLFYADREPVSAVLTIRIPTTDIWSCP